MNEENMMGENILFVSFMNEDIRPGYSFKIHSQVIALSKYKTAYLIIMSNGGIRRYKYEKGEKKYSEDFFLNKKHENKVSEISLDHKKRSRSPVEEILAFRKFSKFVIKTCEEKSIGIVYVRRIVPITPMLISMLKKIKGCGIKVIYEYPTFPWESEMKSAANNFLRKLFYVLDIIFYEKLIRIPNMITYLGYYDGDDSRFFKIQNCGESVFFPLIKKKTRKCQDINLIAVAYISPVHGYDLLLDALKTYYESDPDVHVYFHIVGTGLIVPELQDKCKEYNIDNYVFFHGFKMGKELDEIYSMSDIGINVLKLNNEKLLKTGMTTLKTVEYTFRGLPQISCAPFTIDRNLIDIPEFLYIVDEKINIRSIVDFYNGLTISATEIRNYANMHMSWDKVFKDMFNALKIEVI